MSRGKELRASIGRNSMGRTVRQCDGRDSQGPKQVRIQRRPEINRRRVRAGSLLKGLVSSPRRMRDVG